MNEQQMVAEFSEATGGPGDSYLGWLRLRKSLLREECNEVCEALDGGDVLEIAKELADLLYVTYGTAFKLGIDLHEAFRLVHASNMAKIDANSKPLTRGDGKVLKGAGYVPPDMRTAVSTR